MDKINNKEDLEAGDLAAKEDQTTGSDEHRNSSNNQHLIRPVRDLQAYGGSTLEESVDRLIHAHGVVIFSKSACPFCLDIKDLLANRLGVPVYVLEINQHPDGAAIHKYIKSLTKHTTVPVVFLKGQFVGGCDDVKALHSKNELEHRIADLVVTQRVTGGQSLDTARFVDHHCGSAVHPLFWFPNAVNNHMIRLVGVQVCLICVFGIIFREDAWGHWLSAFLLVDFCLRMMVGSSLSPLGMFASVLAAPFPPDLRAGPAKQFASMVGVAFTVASTWCYFTGHETVAAIILGMLTGAAALEGFGGICIACEFFMFGIEHGLISNSVYRIYTSSRQELLDTWEYKFRDSGASKPIAVDTDPSSKISLKYKKKTDDWTKDDFHLIRNMMPCYFAIPLSLGGLAVAFKLASSWVDPYFRFRADDSTIRVPEVWYQIFATIAAVLYLICLGLFTLRLVFYTKKCRKEWNCPWRSASFGAITITAMLLAFLMYDEIEYNSTDEKKMQKTARVIFGWEH